MVSFNGLQIQKEETEKTCLLGESTVELICMKSSLLRVLHHLRVAKMNEITVLYMLIFFPWYQYIAIPVLRSFDEPNIVSCREVIDLMNQTLEGLVYMHQQNVAHRDGAVEMFIF